MDRLGICAWLVHLLFHEDNEDVRLAIYGAIAIMRVPSHFRERHCVRLEFAHGHDHSDASGQLYDEHRCEVRFSRNAVTARWWHDAADSICGLSVHEKGRLQYNPEKYQNFQSFIEALEDKMIIGKIVKCDCRLGSQGVRGISRKDVAKSGSAASTISADGEVDLGDAEEEFKRLASQMW